MAENFKSNEYIDVIFHCVWLRSAEYEKVCPGLGPPPPKIVVDHGPPTNRLFIVGRVQEEGSSPPPQKWN